MVFFFVESGILYQTALSLVATRPVVSNPPKVAFINKNIDFALITLSNKYVEKIEIYIKLDIHLQLRLSIWRWTLFNILSNYWPTYIFTAVVIIMITYSICTGRAIHQWASPFLYIYTKDLTTIQFKHDPCINVCVIKKMAELDIILCIPAFRVCSKCSD